MLNNISHNVWIYQLDSNIYPKPPFHPSKKYPEYKFGDVQKENIVYESIRSLLYNAHFDKENYGKKSWNPLGKFISPGDIVIIKPNFVRHFHLYDGNIDTMLTHGSVIRAILDYVIIALKSEGKVIIGDAPLQSTDFEEIIRIRGLNEIKEHYNKNNLDFIIKDFRKDIVIKDFRWGNINKKVIIDENINNSHYIDLGKWSSFYDSNHNYQRYRVGEYDKSEMLLHRNNIKNEYCISKHVLESDVVINLPKLKTHKRAGISAAMKNFIGINTRKDIIPHHRIGSISERGDEYLNPNIIKKFRTKINDLNTKSGYYFQPLLNKINILLHNIILLTAKDKIFEGSWYGNDTIWRSIVDMNKIIYFADKKGVIREKPQREILSITDAIISGEGDGPLRTEQKNSNLLIMSFHTILSDLVSSSIMGFDWKKIPQIYNGLEKMNELINGNPPRFNIYWNGKLISVNNLIKDHNLHFKPSPGWKNHVEI